MTLHTIRRWLRPWTAWRAERRLAKANPDYGMACQMERAAARARCTQAVAKARKAKREAVTAALRGGVRHG